jgi:hypothetical protein
MEELIKLECYNEVFNLVMNLKKFTTKDKAPNESGIYFLFKENVVTYIGISQNINDRILGSRGHIFEKDFDYFAFIQINKCNRDLEKIEYSLISFFNPMDNSSNKGFDLHKFLPLDYKEIRDANAWKRAIENAELFVMYAQKAGLWS